jgi:micrococcal nuclease
LNRILAFILILILILLAVACGSSGDEVPTQTPTSEPASEETAAATPTDEPTTGPTLTRTEEPTPTPTNPPPTPTATAPAALPVPNSQPATVTNIVDGDTIDVDIDGQTYRVRYIGMDTPERGGPYFDEATQANQDLVGGQTVYLVKDVSETDRFGRLLRYVYLADGTFVNAKLVEDGYAQVASFPPDVAQIDHFLQLQETARNASLGLWALAAADDAAQATNTPEPQPTATPLPAATSTPTAAATPTPLPPDTATPTPAATEPPAPAPANVQITYIYFDGQVARVESDEYAVVTNNGGSAVNMSGWRLNAGDPGQDFGFPGIDLQPGQSCRIYTNMVQPDSCGGGSFFSGRAIWNNDGDCGRLYDPTGAEVSTYCY